METNTTLESNYTPIKNIYENTEGSITKNKQYSF